MKKLFFSFTLIMAMSTYVSSQVTVSYNMGKNFNKVAVGYAMKGNIEPYIGFQYLGTSFSASTNGDENGSFSASAFMPNLGLKYYFVNRENLKAGLNLGFYKPFFSVKSSDNEFEDVFRDVLDNTKIFVGELGFVSEYYLNPAFSIGGEFGLRLLSGKFEDTFDGDKLAAKSNINFTYTSFSLNYHF